MEYSKINTERIIIFVKSIKLEFLSWLFFIGEDVVPAVASMVIENVKTWGEADDEDYHDAEQDEGVGHEGDLLQVPPGKRSRHGWWL